VLGIRILIDPHNFLKSDLNPHQSEKPDPAADPRQSRILIDLHQSQSFKVLWLWRLKMGPWRVLDVRNGGLEAQNGAVELGSVDQCMVADSHYVDLELDPDPDQNEKRSA
jgi:hypothetical protein